MKRDGLYLGVDVGSVSAKVAVLDQKRNVLYKEYSRTRGEPLLVVLDMLKRVKKVFPEGLNGVAVTGSAGKLISTLMDSPFTNEIVAHGTAVLSFHPSVRTVIEIGGQDSKLILLEPDRDGKGQIKDFSMNTVCAAGTGAFLDQQAARLGLSIEEFSSLALTSQNPPRIAGRCSVFAKSDMIHLQQAGTHDYDIVAGLCHALARNFKATIGKGREFKTPVGFQGGVAANAGMRRAFRDAIGCGDEDIIIPEHYNIMGAIGAALHAMEKGEGALETGKLEGFISSQKAEKKGLAPLSLKKTGKKDRIKPDIIGKRLYIGLDIGSISTNIVALTEEGETAARRYIFTTGKPLSAVSRGLREIGDEIAGAVISGVGITGSGRYLIGEVVGADLIKDEITAQAAAAVHIEPGVDTVIEIGGQDAKYIQIRNGVVTDFEMNKACAAGTGSFLEEQAERLGLSIKEDFGRLALESKYPAPLGEKCTVFMESDLVHHQQRGSKKDELVAGLSYSIVHNYINKVALGKPIGEKILFLGGVAANQGVVAAFEKVTGKDIHVPIDHDVTGAIGAALLAMKGKAESSRFKGFDVDTDKVNIEGFQCMDCSNLCDVKKLNTDGGVVFFGGRCGKYDRKKKLESKLPDLFHERKRLLMGEDSSLIPHPSSLTKTVGIPMTLPFHEILPFWRGFFTSLGMKVVVTETGKKTIQKGIEAVVAETCFPVKVAHGHIADLLEKKVDYIFLPSIIDFSEGNQKNCYCPYIQALPYTIRSAMDLRGIKLLAPVVRFTLGRKELEKSLLRMTREAGIKGDVRDAVKAGMEAQRSFYTSMRDRGEEILKGMKGDERGVVIVGRPYNTCDAALNMDIPSRLREIGVLPIPMDMLPLKGIDISDLWNDMYWSCGKKILSAARLISGDERLHAIYITNFGCGPDSFITRYFEEEMKGKPFLQLEVDEHSADAGAITRCEAFVESLRNIKKSSIPATARMPKIRGHEIKKRKMLLPPMTDHIHALSSALQACGLDSSVLPMHDLESLELGKKYSTGRECYPYVLTTGEMLKALREESRNVAFLMPTTSGPCRFGQYWRLQRIILDSLGYEDVPIYAPDQENDIYQGLGLDNSFTRLAWHGIVAVDIIEKKLRKVRPFEKTKGEADEVYGKYLKKI
ncbi:MAG: acyl-CoA dehydratase activase, partial [Deltaproteobacteria bacterium]